ncbi:hypothetical protein ACIQU4_06140 [Streptomyces sp. NPDC090741]|uniref:hypothetical protein n=1 Tax=Streptomyces sp. NPDC090741 TaxID=3365967 RepID=UPI0038234CAF
MPRDLVTAFTLGHHHHVVAVCGLALAPYAVASLRDRRVSARCPAGALLVLLRGTRLAAGTRPEVVPMDIRMPAPTASPPPSRRTCTAA